MSLLTGPVEWLTLWFDMPWILLLSDIRQGIFYSVLLCFWIIFCGEHMMVSNFVFYSNVDSARHEKPAYTCY